MRGLTLFLLGLLIGTVAGAQIIHFAYSKAVEVFPQLKKYGMYVKSTDYITIYRDDNAYTLIVDISNPVKFNMTIPINNSTNLVKNISSVQKVEVRGNEYLIDVKIVNEKPIIS